MQETDSKRQHQRSSPSPQPTDRQKMNPELNGSEPGEGIRSVPIDWLVTPKRQARRYFDLEAMEKLAASIREHGILQPLLVRPAGDKYEVVAGERRYRGARIVGLAEVPVMVREMTDVEALQYGLVENLQREDLNPVEETEEILQLLVLRLERQLADVISLLYRLENEAKGKVARSASGNSENEKTKNEADRAEGKVTRSASGNSDREIVERVFVELGRMNWRSFVRTRLPLLKLPPEILGALREGRIEWTKAKEISKLEPESERVELLERAIAQALTLRELQKIVKEKKAPQEQPQDRGKLQTEMAGIAKRFSKFKAWSNPDKRSKIESLLQEALEALLSEEK